MAITLTNNDLFGLNTEEQESLKKIVRFLEASSEAGDNVFPEIPFIMFYGFEWEEARSLNAILEWAWNNPGTDQTVPGYLLMYGFGDGEEPALVKLVQRITGAGLGNGGGGAAPSGFVFLLDTDGQRLTDSDNAYLLEAA